MDIAAALANRPPRTRVQANESAAANSLLELATGVRPPVRGTRVQANAATPSVQGQLICPPPPPWYPQGHIMPPFDIVSTLPLAVSRAASSITAAERQLEVELIRILGNVLRYVIGEAAPNFISGDAWKPRTDETDAQFLQRFRTALSLPTWGISEQQVNYVIGRVTPDIIAALRSRRGTVRRGTVQPARVYYGPVQRHRPY